MLAAWFGVVYMEIFVHSCIICQNSPLRKLTERLSLSDLLVGGPRRAPEQMLTGYTSVWASALAENKRSGFMKATEGP